MGTLKITKIMILRRKGYTDQIFIKVEGPSPYPELEANEPGLYPPTLSIEVRRGYSEEWLRGMGLDPSQAELVETI